MGPNLITTVVTKAATYDLTTLAIIKDELGIENNTSNVKLQRYLSSASAAAAQYCNRVFPAETVKDEFWAQRDRAPRLLHEGYGVLQLSRWPIVAGGVTSVVENGVTLVDGTDFRVDYANGQLIRLDISGYPRSWPAYPIAVTFTAGFAPIPNDVVDAVIRMVRSRWLGRDRDPMAREVNIPGVREVQYWIPTGTDAGNMSPDITDILDNYRIPVIA